MGAILLGLHVGNPNHPFEGVFLELGAGLILFAGLFVYERQLVERTAETVFRRITSREELADLGASTFEQGDFMDPLGPVETAKTFINALLEDDFELAWKVMDSNFQVCRTQAWAFNNQAQLLDLGIDVGDGELDELLHAFKEGHHNLLESFFQIELSMFKGTLKRFSFETHGLASGRRILGPRHELIQFLKLPKGHEHGGVIEGTALVEGSVAKVVVAHVENHEDDLRYLVAAFQSEVAPVPGWPPTFWERHDPVALEVHPGLKANKASMEEE